MSTSRFETAAILGAPGPTGFHLARALRDRDVRVVVSSRSEEKLQSAFGGDGFEIRAADALDGMEVRRAVEGCEVIFDCIGLPGDRMADHPPTARNVVEAARAVGARCIHVSSTWAYLPQQRSPLDEEHPRQGGGPWMRQRREAEEEMLAGGAAVAHLPDFYGPQVHTSTLQRPLQQAAAGQAMQWLGSGEIAREYVFVPDAMEAIADLAAHPEAGGQRWIVPGAGPLDGRSAARIAGDVLGRDVALRSAGKWLLRLVALFDRDLRGFLQVLPEYFQAVAYDGAKLEGLIGPLRKTPYTEGFQRTLDWLRKRELPAR